MVSYVIPFANLSINSMEFIKTLNPEQRSQLKIQQKVNKTEEAYKTCVIIWFK